MAKLIRITSKREGFRRAGMAHSATPTQHPASTFTAKQVEALKAEPMLIVDEIDDGKDDGKDGAKKPAAGAKQ